MKLAIVIALFAAAAYGQEIKVLLDNDWVKVTHIKDKPGDKRPTHTHKDSVVIALTDHKRRVIGKTTNEFDIKTNAAMWFADVTHSEENIGTTEGELLLVDIKKPAGSYKPEAAVANWPDKLEADRFQLIQPSRGKGSGESDLHTGFSVPHEPRLVGCGSRVLFHSLDENVKP